MGAPGAQDVLEVLTEVRELAWRRCVAAAGHDPRPQDELPADEASAGLHRSLSQAAVHCAQAAQAMVLPDAGPVAAMRAARRARALLQPAD